MEKCKIYHTIVEEWHTQYFQFILDHPDKLWDWTALSSNPNIRWEIVQKHLDKPWNWYCLCTNPSVITSWEIVSMILQKCPKKDWKWIWPALSRNPSVVIWEIVEKYLDNPWDWSELSWNPNITWGIVQKYLDKPW